MRTRMTLAELVNKHVDENRLFTTIEAEDLVRAGYDLLARRIRKLKRRSNERILTPSPYMSYLSGVDDVLALLKDLRR